ncbi:TetR family transcriptional regulator [Salimicrobium jeotgali]|uniref:TetR family transcriptional regulator n=2 Tax=Salimicrobium TaxID=351195 RepID=K2GAP8_9BACI|nr:MULTISPECIES: TetR/AcrR family transcriptional regulator [Salimicrobium]AKG03711.1 TetR family transcriptional regulator [Salimicrobium jeotgali]EKE31437.1 TetR family transcriptional regulator [Salimicrobium jeotgali]MBM7697047.1 AcrR family transcriptional regulator [Salimicrobium jeotgali]SIS81811.1 transcriptional regulator, TetR family [Salimicrobium salexigens]
MAGSKQVPSSIKNRALVEKRRQEMIRGAVSLFRDKGFHKTTTREIAKASGFSIGTLYEYIRTKEDVLFLVCDSIYEQVNERMKEVVDTSVPDGAPLEEAVRSYFRLMDDLQEEVIVLYQEVKALPKEAKDYILEKEQEMVAMLEELLACSLPGASRGKISVIANNVFVEGQMWGFRRWILQRSFTLEEYIDHQVSLLLEGVATYR